MYNITFSHIMKKQYLFQFVYFSLFLHNEMLNTIFYFKSVAERDEVSLI